MAVIETIWVDPPREKTEEEHAADQEAIDNLQNSLLSGEIDLSGLSSMSPGEIWNSGDTWLDQVREDTESILYKEAMRSGGGMDNAYNSSYMGHFYIAEDGLRYKKVMSWDEERQQMKVELHDERVYRWSPSDEHKRTHRDEATAQAAVGQEFGGGGGSGWYTEEEIRGAWDAGDMRQMQEQGVEWDQYWGYVTGIDDLVNAGELDYNDASNWMENEAYNSLVTGLGIPLQFENRGDIYNFNGFGYSRDYWSEKSEAGPIIKALGAAAIAWAAGPAIAGGLGFTGGVAGGVANGVIGSAIGQGITTGKINPEDLVTAGILGGLGGWFDDMIAGGDIVMDGGSLTNVTDNAIWDLSDILGVDYETAATMVEGIAGGLIEGTSLEGIIRGAVGTWGGSKINDWVSDYFGNAGVDVSNWFREGETTIPTEALSGIAEGVFDAAVAGGMSDMDALNMMLGYFNDGGSLDFIWPEGVDFGWLEGKDIDWPNISLPDWLPNFPGFDLPDIDINLPNIPNPCGEGMIWDADLSECIPDIDINLPPVNIECPDGFQWDDTAGECIQIPNPCGEGMIWDADLGECVTIPEIGVECPDGFRWDDTRGECIQIPEITCPEGWEMGPDGECLEIDIPFECPEGMRWDDLRGECIQIPPINIECPEGLQWDETRGECIQIPEITCPEGFRSEGGECVEIKVPEVTCPDGFRNEDGECLPIDIQCPEGFKSENGECVEIKVPEVTCPEGFRNENGKCVEIEVPQIDGPDLPKVGLGMLSGGSFAPKWGDLFKYTTLTPYQQKALAPQVNYIQQAKGMLDV